MASSVIQAGSPLDDYFNDEAGLSNERDHTAPPPSGTEEAGDTTLVDALCDDSANLSSASKTTGWTGSIPNIPSSSTSPSSPTSPSRLRRLNLKKDSSDDELLKGKEMEIFGERFKYLICTSGLLEKVYIPCLGGARTEEVDISPEHDIKDTVDDKADNLDEGMEDWRRRGLEDIQLWIRRMRERQDITAAGIVLLAAMAWVVGWKVFIGLGMGISVVAVLLWRGQSPGNLKPLISTNKPPAVSKSEEAQEPNAGTLSSLQDLMTASTTLDSTIDSALSIFQGHPDSSTSHHDLRLAIHRLTETMTDHLGTATSTLLEMVDRTELGILGEMYDIPIGPTSNRNRAQTISDDELDLKSLKRLSWNASKSLIPLSLPMGTSSSSPARLHSDRGHTVHLSLGGMPLEDRFTTVPKRTPRSIKRSSWAAEWNDRSADGTDLITLSERPTLKSIPSESIQLQNSSSSESREYELPKTPNPQRDQASTPRRSSPLSRRDSTSSDPDTFQRHIFPIVPPTPAKYPLLPSPFRSPIRDEQKRRSLQTMPYFHSDKSDIASPGRASISGSSDMARTGSLQVSDLQMLRDQSTNGLIPSHSIESLASRAGFTPTRPKRIANRTTESPSLSPLTLPGLKAACLGVHIKRRRVACCLLGLKFDQDEEYWTEVKRVLVDLVAGINAAVHDLQVVEREARVAVKPSSLSTSVPPWMVGELFPAARADYAPRTSDHALLLQQIESMEATLHRTWSNLQALRPALSSSEDLTSPWAGIRGDLGELIRDWERGKDIVSRLDAATHPADVVSLEEGEEGDLEPMPPFLKAWEEESTDSVRSTSVDTHDTFSSNPHETHFDPLAAEVLPPPGQDLVFESIPMPIVPRAKARMSREDRIKAMKEARDNPPVEVKGVAEMGGDVVGELKSMIGIIRRRKGIAEAEPNPVTPVVEEVRDERQKLPMGFTDDLKKAFVFPPPHVDQHSH